MGLLLAAGRAPVGQEYGTPTSDLVPLYSGRYHILMPPRNPDANTASNTCAVDVHCQSSAIPLHRSYRSDPDARAGMCGMEDRHSPPLPFRRYGVRIITNRTQISPSAWTTHTASLQRPSPLRAGDDKRLPFPSTFPPYCQMLCVIPKPRHSDLPPQSSGQVSMEGVVASSKRWEGT